MINNTNVRKIISTLSNSYNPNSIEVENERKFSMMRLLQKKRKNKKKTDKRKEMIARDPKNV